MLASTPGLVQRYHDYQPSKKTLYWSCAALVLCRVSGCNLDRRLYLGRLGDRGHRDFRVSIAAASSRVR
jgi:hypothetical protein